MIRSGNMICLKLNRRRARILLAQGDVVKMARTRTAGGMTVFECGSRDGTCRGIIISTLRGRWNVILERRCRWSTFVGKLRRER